MLLHHGTTRGWAKEIIKNSPDPYFKPPDVEGEPEGFFTALAAGPFPFGSPEEVARGKARSYPQTGDPVILEIEIPDHLWPDIVGQPGHEEDGKGVDRDGEIWFGIDHWDTGKDYGVAKLRAVWSQLKKRIITLKGT